MANFQIPQFIETEDKIVGPLTLRQFLYLAGAGGVSFLLFFIFQFWLWLMVTIFVGVLAAAAAFIKYNGQPLPRVAFSAFLFLWRPRLYLWQRESQFKEVSAEADLGPMAHLQKLWQDLLTRKTAIPKREKPIRRARGDRYQIYRKITGAKEIARRVDYR